MLSFNKRIELLNQQKPFYFLLLVLSISLIGILRVEIRGEKIYYQSDRINVNQKSSLSLLSGNARVYNSKIDLRAKSIEVNEKYKILIAQGDVKLDRKAQGRVQKFRGQYLRYNYQDDIAWAHNKVQLHDPKDNTSVDANYLHALLKQNLVTFKTNVKMHMQNSTNSFVLSGDVATYNLKTSKLNMESNCQINADDLEGYADAIEGIVDKNNFWLLGNVILHELGTPNDNSSSSPATKSHPKTRSRTNNKKKSLPKIKKTRLNIVKADKANYLGDTNEVIYFYSNVSMSNYADQTTLDADYISHYKNEDYSIAKVNAKMKDVKNNLEIYSDSFESFGTNNLLYAKGNVKLLSESNQVNSLIAIYDKNKDKITLYGNPSVQKKNNRLYADTIFFYPEKDYLEMKNHIKGVLFFD